MPIAGVIASSISGHLSTNNYFLISQSLPSAVSTVTFSSIPSTYKSLQVRFNLVWSVANANGVPNIQFNGDTGSNYTYHVISNNGASTAAAGSITQPSILPNGNYGAQGITYPEVGIIDVIDYTNTNKNKTTKALYGFNNNTATGGIAIGSGLWLSTAAITSLTIYATVGTFTGTVSLYGIS